MTFRGGNNGNINVYGNVLWDTNTVSRTDVSTVTFYKPGNTWTNLNISVGSVVLGADNVLPTTSQVDFNQNSAGASFLRLNDFNQTLASLRSSTIGTTSFTQQVDTATRSVLTLNDAGASNVFGGVFMGTGSILKMGNGTLILATNNSSFTGGLLINDGTLSMGSGTTGGAITSYITNNAKLIINKTDNLTLPNPISGAGQLVKVNTGTLTLPAINTYSGTTTLSNGTTQVTGQLAGTGAVSVYGGILMGNGSIAGPTTVYTNAQLQTTTAPTPGTLTFGNNLTMNRGGYATYKFGGPTTIGGGVNDLFDVKGNLTLNNNPLVLVPVGPLKVGDTYTVATAGGTISGTFGSITNPTRYTFTAASAANKATLTVSGGAPSGLVWQGTNANWDLAAFNWLNGAARDKFYQADSVVFDDSATISSISLGTALYPGLVTVDATNTYTFAGSGKLSGATGLIKTNSGLLVVSNANDFTGPVYVNAGMLKVGSTTALGATNGGAFVADGATLELNGVSLYNPGDLITITGAGLDNTGAVINSTADLQNGIRYLALAGDATVGTWTNRWDIRGPGGNSSMSGGLYLNGHTLTKLGTNKMALADIVANGPGSIVMSEGVLAVTRSIVDGPGVVDIGAGLLQFENSSTGYLAKPIIVSGGTISNPGGSDYGLNSAITNHDVTFDVASGRTLTLSNVITGPGGVTKANAGTLALEQPNLSTGPTVVNGGTLRLDPGSGIPNSSSITLANGSTFDATLLGTFTLQSGQGLGGSGTVMGDVVAGPGSIVTPGTSIGTLALQNSATFNNSTVNFELGADPLMPGSSDLVTVGFGLTLGGVNTIKLIPTATLSSANPYNLFQYAFLTAGGAANLNVVTDSRYSFSLLDPATTYPYVQVQVVGSATAANLVWSGGDSANPTLWDLKTTPNWLNGATRDKFYAGDSLTFNDTAATNRITLSGALSPANLLFVNNGLSYLLDGSGSVAAGNLTNSGAGSVTFVNSADNTFGSFEVDNGSVTLANAGADNFPLGLVVNGGLLRIANGTANVFAQSPVINNGVLAFGNDGVNTFSAGLAPGGGSVIFTNAGANAFGPGFSQFGGTITLANAFNNNLGTATGSGVNGTLEFAQPVNAVASGTLNGGGTVVKQLSNTLALTGNNNQFSGTVQVNAGVLRSGSTGAFGGGTVNVASGATLDIGGQNAQSATIVNIQGTGTNGVGAVINSGADQNNGPKNLTLAADATVGGTGRWDVRGPTANAFLGVLDLANHTLTKIGPNKSAIVDSVLLNDGPIVMQSGIMGFTRCFATNFAPIFVNTNIFQFENFSTGYVSKPFVTDGSTIQVTGNSCGINSLVTNLAGGVKVDVASGLTFYLSNTITGSGELRKLNTGALRLLATNDFAGDVFVQGGNLQMGNYLALSTNKTIWLTNTTGATGGDGATLDLLADVVTPPSLALVANSTNSPDIRASLRNVSTAGTNEFTGPITLLGNGRFALNTGGNATNFLTVSGPISGPSTTSSSLVFLRGGGGIGVLSGQVNFAGQVFKTDGGTWVISSSDSTWGSSGVAVGILRLGANNALCTNAPLTMGQGDANSATLDLNGFNQAVPVLANNGTGGPRRIGNDSTLADSVFTYAGTNASSTYAGQFLDNLTTNGNHKLALTLASGTLYLTGNNTNTGPTTVQSGATLGGTGTLRSTVAVQPGGTLAPGTTAIGTLTISNALTFADGSAGQFKISSSTYTNDKVVGLSSVAYAGTLVITNTSATLLTNGASFKLFSATNYSGNFTAVASSTPGQAVTWDISQLPVDGSIRVTSVLNLAPPSLTNAVVGGSLQLSWPADHLGWRLLVQTNNLVSGLSTNLVDWDTVAGSTATNSVTVPIDSAKPTEFYKLVYP